MIYKERLNRDFENSDKNSKIQEAYMKVLNPMLDEDASNKALGTLKAIMGMFKGHEDNDIYVMAKGMKKSYDKNKGFSTDQAKWIWKTSVALFKKG